jgi:hypothetical protein
MGNSPQPLAAETEALRQAYAALNSNDVAGFVKAFDPDIERVEPPDFPMGGTYRGIAAVTEHVKKGRGTWAEGTCEPERFIAAGDKVIVVAHVHVRLKTEIEWREGRIADGYTFRNGKAIQFLTFGELRQALDWAGIKDPRA